MPRPADLGKAARDALLDSSGEPSPSRQAGIWVRGDGNALFSNTVRRLWAGLLFELDAFRGNDLRQTIPGPRRAAGDVSSRTMQDRLLGLVSLRRGEGARVLLCGLYLFLVVASYLLMKAIRNAFFISEFGALKLPWAMLGIAVLTGGVVAVYIRMARRVPPVPLTAGALLFFSSNVVVFWFLAGAGGRWLYPVLYVWSGIFGVLATSQVWTLANELFTVREAKRVFGVVGAGGILGAAAGGSAAYRLAGVLGTTHLLLVVAGLLGAAAGTVLVLGRLRPAGDPVAAEVPRPRNLRDSLLAVRRSGHLRLLAALAFVAAAATTTIDFQFNVIVAGAVPDRDALTSFLGAVYGATSVFGFLIQVLVTGRLLSHLGVGVAILLLPVSLLTATGAAALWRTLWAGVFLKGSDGALKHSLDRACRELMFLPVPSTVRLQTKAAIDTVADRAGDGFAGALQLVLIEGLGAGLKASLLLNAVLVGTWLVLAVGLRRNYVAQLRANLAAPGAVEDVPGLEDVSAEGDARAVVEDLLATGSEEQKLAALEWAGRSGLRLPEGRLLAVARDDPSPPVRAAALASLLGSPGAHLPPDLEAALEGEGRDVLAAAIDVVTGDDAARAEEVLARAGTTGRLPLLALLLGRLGPALEPFAGRVLDSLLAPGAAPALRRSAAGTLALLPTGSALLRVLPDLLGDPDPLVASAAAGAVARHGRTDLAAAVVGQLGRSRVRPAARAALQALGAEAAPALLEALRDTGAPAAVRRQVPRLLGRCGPGAMPALLEGLADPDPVVVDRCAAAIRSAALRRADRPVARRDLARHVLGRARALQDLRRMERAVAGRAGNGTTLPWLLDALAAEGARIEEAILATLSLEIDPREAARIAHALRHGGPAARANALELLANQLPGSIEFPVMAALEGAAGREEPIAAERALAQLAAHPRPWIAATARTALEEVW